MNVLVPIVASLLPIVRLSVTVELPRWCGRFVAHEPSRVVVIPKRYRRRRRAA